MHARQRSPGNGYRSSSMGMGLAGSSFYASDYRRDNGFGRGHDNPKSFPPPPSRKGDIFMEAGRLAAEYLVSQGLLPPNALSIRSQNASFKKHSVELQDGDSLEGRTSALARLGNPIPDRRKFGLDNFNPKLRRRGASFASNGSASDWGRDFKRTASWSDKLRASPDIKDNDDAIARHPEHRQPQQQVGVDNVSQKSNSNESAPKTEDVCDFDAEPDKDLVSSKMDLPASSSGASKDTYTEGVEFVKSFNDLGNTVANKELKDITRDNKVEKPSISNNLLAPLSVQGSQNSSGVCADLLTLCKSVKVPTRTRTRSSLTHRGLKADPLRHNGDESNKDMGCLQRHDVLADSESGKGSASSISLTEKAYDHLDSENSKVQSVHSAENVKELDAKFNAEEGASLRSQSCQDKADIHDDNPESDLRLAEDGTCSSKVEGRGEKRAAEADDPKEDAKKLREWLPSVVPRTEDYFLHNNSIVKKEISGEDEDSHNKVTLSSDHGSLMRNPQFTQGGDRQFLQYSEEKQLLPSSFRTCDLNLIEASEIHESDEDDPILIYPSVSESNKGATPIGIDLSISHSTVSGEFNECMTGGKEIEVIDLENDSVQDGKSINNAERKTEAVFPGLEGFTNHAQNSSDRHDVQDGYGLMISELLGPDFPNCSSVPADINSVHNEMGLHNGTGTLGEDDSIYMPFGEISLSFLQTWEQPPSQDYEKPF